jgi:hypothetical protein
MMDVMDGIEYRIIVRNFLKDSLKEKAIVLVESCRDICKVLMLKNIKIERTAQRGPSVTVAKREADGASIECYGTILQHRIWSAKVFSLDEVKPFDLLACCGIDKRQAKRWYKKGVPYGGKTVVNVDVVGATVGHSVNIEI